MAVGSLNCFAMTPSRFYLVDRRAKTAELLARENGAKPVRPLSSVRPVVVPARDGLELVRYLTLPESTSPAHGIDPGAHQGVVGEELKQAQSDYDGAFGKLSIGRGNLVGQAQKLRQLGVKPTKSLSPALVDGAYESDELPFVLEADAAGTPVKTENGRGLGDLSP